MSELQCAAARKLITFCKAQAINMYIPNNANLFKSYKRNDVRRSLVTLLHTSGRTMLNS